MIMEGKKAETGLQEYRSGGQVFLYWPEWRDTMKKRRVLLPVLILVLALALAGCSRFKADKDLVGDAALITSTEGLERIDDKEIPVFLEKLAAKYAMIRPADLSGEFALTLRGSAASGKLGGLGVEMSGDMQGVFELAESGRIAHVNTDCMVTALGVNVPAGVESYTVKEARGRTVYTGISALGSQGKWMKQYIAGSDDGEFPSLGDFLSSIEIKELWQDRNTKAYAVVLNVKPDGISVRIGNKDITGEIVAALGNNGQRLLVTFDEGLGIVGFASGIDEIALPVDSLHLDILSAQVKITGINSGLELAVPEEALSAEEESNFDLRDIVSLLGILLKR